MAFRGKKEVASDIFRKHYNNLSVGLQDHLPTLVSNLYSESLVSVDIRNRILDNSTSQLEKSMGLLRDVEDRIKSDHTALEKFCEVLCCQDVGLSHLGEPMRLDFQQLCQTSAKSTFHGSYGSSAGSASASVVPTAESQPDNRNEGASKAPPSRLVQYDLGSGLEQPLDTSYVKSFPTPQHDQYSVTYGDSEQVVPINESLRPVRANTVSPSCDLSMSHFASKSASRNRDVKEKLLLSDMVLSWDRMSRKCEKCENIQLEYDSKLEKVKQYYEEQLQKSSTDKKSETAFQVKKLEEDKQHLLRTIDIQTEEKVKRFKENEVEIQRLQECLSLKIKEQEELKRDISENKRELHKMKQLARQCPIYNSKTRREYFERKKTLCTDIQSLVVHFFTTQNPDEKGELRKKIQDKLAHFTPLKRRRSFSH